MIDDGDVALMTPNSGCGMVVFVVITCVLAYYSCENKKDCRERSCPEGEVPALTNHDCLCVRRAR